VVHTVEVTAATLYEAVAQGLNAVKASVADVRVEHEVKRMEFTKWLERDGGSPRETSDRNRIRAIPGMSTSRSNQPAGGPFPGQDDRDTNRKR